MRKTLVLTALALLGFVHSVGFDGTLSAHAASDNTAIASWYGPGLYGNILGCSSFGHLHTYTWGVASKTLPCGTKVRICYNRCVTTVVIDRGPYVAGRDFDLTAPVAERVGLTGVKTIRWWRIN